VYAFHSAFWRAFAGLKFGLVGWVGLNFNQKNNPILFSFQQEGEH
jgi:hypothetical protein